MSHRTVFTQSWGNKAWRTFHRPSLRKTWRHYNSLGIHISRDFSSKPEDDLLIVDKYEALRESYNAPKYPIVLCHGLMGFDQLNLIPSRRDLEYMFATHISSAAYNRLKSQADTKKSWMPHFGFEYWRGIEKVLTTIGGKVIVARVPPLGTIDARAGSLLASINHKVVKQEVLHSGKDTASGSEKEYTKSGKRKVNLIAHSMGGLDARYLISKLKPSDFEVVSLTTISTPHRGSAFADYTVEFSKKSFIPVPDCIYELTRKNMIEKFNPEILDDPNTKYYSFGARFKPDWYHVFAWPWRVINRVEGDNDGMVSVASAKWGSYLGTLDQVDHLDLINWTNTLKEILSKVTGEESKFNAAALYLDIADRLANDGF